MKNAILKLFFFIFVLLALSGCGATVNGKPVDMITFFQNLQYSYRGLWLLITATAYLTGAIFITNAVFQLKIYGESRTMMTGHANIWKPLAFLFVGAVLMSLPTIFHAMMVSTFGYANYIPLEYAETEVIGWGTEGKTLTITPALLGFVQIVGLISFVRGWVLLIKLTDQGSHNAFGKAITHIIGGLLCINIVGVQKILLSLFAQGNG